MKDDKCGLTSIPHLKIKLILEPVFFSKSGLEDSYSPKNFSQI